MDYYRDRLTGILGVLDSERRSHRMKIENVFKRDLEYGERVHCFDAGQWVPFSRTDTWGGHEVHAAFKANISIPKEYAGKTVAVTLNTGATDIWNTDNPQFLVYVNGQMICGHDMNHNEIILCTDAIPGEVYEYGLYAYSNGAQAVDFIMIDASVVEADVEKLYYDMKVPFEIASLMKNTDKLQNEYYKVLNDAASLLDLRDRGSSDFHDSVVKCNEYIQKYIYDENTSLIERDPVSSVTVSSVGHTHIDVAWKWPLRQTREKVLRSFATVLYEMDRYPEFKFMSSQPQLYEYVKEECPELYARIKDRVKEGRWETEGAMWLEADCNIASGESLIRQILFGTIFFKEEFGTENNKVLWLPDVFGYSACMPQIMKKSRIRYFMTTKLGWNESNQIPNDTFMWKGIDGTEILTYFISTHDYITDPELNTKRTAETTYNGRQNANQLMGCWQRYQNKDINDNVLTCFGWGDGGGGATLEMLEESRRLEHRLPGCPRAKQSHVLEFFEGLEKRLEGKKVPVWNGELYLEYHRGTYTSMARNKKFNRKCEYRNQDAETFATVAYLLGGIEDYPDRELKNCWKLVLLNQFHDILPGSAIEDVYIDSLRQYNEVWEAENNIINRSLDSLVRKIENPPVRHDSASFARDHIYVFNNTSFERTETVTSDGLIKVFEYGSPAPVPAQYTSDRKTVWVAGHIPPKGYKVFAFEPAEDACADFEEVDLDAFDTLDYSINTAFYEVRFNKNMEISSIYDKENRREVLMQGEFGNALTAFEDIPKEYDAWNIDAYYKEKSWSVRDVSYARVTESGPVRTCVVIGRKFNKSVIRQTIYFYNYSRRIDFKTEIDWNESQILLKAFFPFDIITNKANFEIQYGNVERSTHENTSWDKARFEVCAHKWADVSEIGYGVALMNDSKYGYSVHEANVALTLLRSGIFPNPSADKEKHEFTYSILPHVGDFRQGNVIKESYFLNCPVYTVTGDRPWEYSKSWFYGLPENVILEVVKFPHRTGCSVVKTEDVINGVTTKSASVILRLYESFGARASVVLKTPLSVASAFECDMLEYTTKRLEMSDEGVEFTMKPYEIKTIKLIVNC